MLLGSAGDCGLQSCRWFAFLLLFQHLSGRFEHVASEEELPVGGHHHYLNLVRKFFGDDFVDEQRIGLERERLALQPLLVCGGDYANTIRLGGGQQLLPLLLSFAVDHLRLRLGFGVLDCGLLARFGFELGLLDLFLL